MLTRLKQPEERMAYARAASEHGWSRNVLNIHIETRRLERTGKAVTNFNKHLPAPGSDLAQQSPKDPYLFDFVDVGREADERDIEALPELFQISLSTIAQIERELQGEGE